MKLKEQKPISYSGRKISPHRLHSTRGFSPFGHSFPTQILNKTPYFSCKPDYLSWLYWKIE
jgi:hypothetical protein